MAREMLTVGVALDPEREVERQLRAEELKAHLLKMLAEGKGAEAIDQVMARMFSMDQHADRMAWRLLRALRYRFGSSSEKLSREELQQLFLAFGGDETEAAEELPVPAPEEPDQVEEPTAVAPEPTSNATAEPAKKKKRQRVRSMQVASSVERIVTEVVVPEEERACAVCRSEMPVFDHVEHERIVYVPAKIVVHVERREKRGCTACRQDITVAPRTETPHVVRKVDASLLAKLVTEKCVMGLPLDRQRRELARMGLDVPDKTLQSYWSYATDLLEPVAMAEFSNTLSSCIVGADDSHLKTLDKSTKRGIFRGHLWCFVGTDGAVGGPETVAYAYAPSWDAAEITDWFATIDGLIQCDGYAGYAREVIDEEGHPITAVPPERRLGCGMHIRSKFHDALLAKDGRAAVALKCFADLYAIEADCKARGLDANARGEERSRRSWPILNTLDGWVDTIHPKLLPRSPLRIATTYAQNQREFFRRCFEDGRFEIDNGRVERRIRMFAVARRNFLFTGSVRGGERLAAAFTLVDNCLLLGIDPERYLVDVIGKLEARWPLRRLSELTPRRWAAEHAAQQRPK
jgi:transposase